MKKQVDMFKILNPGRCYGCHGRRPATKMLWKKNANCTIPLCDECVAKIEQGLAKKIRIIDNVN